MIRTTPMRYNVEQEPLVLNKQITDLLLNTERPSDLLSLYCFYYYTAKWQSTDQPKATTAYVAKGLKWSEHRVRVNKKELITMGLIEDCTYRNDDGTITGHFVRLNLSTTLTETHTVGCIKSNTNKVYNNKKNKKENKTQLFIQLFPAKWQSDSELIQTITDLYTHRTQKGKFTPIAQQRMAAKLSKYDKATVIRAVQATIDNGWTGVFPDNYISTNQKQRNKPEFIYDDFGVRYKLCDDGRYRHPKSGDLYIP